MLKITNFAVNKTIKISEYDNVYTNLILFCNGYLVIVIKKTKIVHIILKHLGANDH